MVPSGGLECPWALRARWTSSAPCAPCSPSRHCGLLGRPWRNRRTARRCRCHPETCFPPRRGRPLNAPWVDRNLSALRTVTGAATPASRGNSATTSSLPSWIRFAGHRRCVTAQRQCQGLESRLRCAVEARLNQCSAALPAQILAASMFSTPVPCSRQFCSTVPTSYLRATRSAPRPAGQCRPLTVVRLPGSLGRTPSQSGRGSRSRHPRWRRPCGGRCACRQTPEIATGLEHAQGLSPSGGIGHAMVPQP